MSIRRLVSVAVFGAALLFFHHTVTAGGTDKDAPKQFESKDHKFKVNIPGVPQVKKQNVGGIEQTIYAVDQGSRAYLVFHQVNPGDTKGLEAKMLEGAVSGIETVGKVQSKKGIKLAGKYPGVEVHVIVERAKGVEVRDRIYIVGDKLYQVMVSGDNAFINSDQAKKFLDSFQVVP